MELERQVVSLPLAQKLKALGVKQESWYAWHLAGTEPTDWRLSSAAVGYHCRSECVAAFSVAELGELLPIGCLFGRIKKGWNAYRETDDGEFTEEHSTEAEARGALLCALIEAAAVKP